MQCTNAAATYSRAHSEYSQHRNTVDRCSGPTQQQSTHTERSQHRCTNAAAAQSHTLSAHRTDARTQQPPNHSRTRSTARRKGGEEGFTSGKGPSCGVGLIMPLASIAGAPCCDHTACGVAVGPDADVGGLSHAQARPSNGMRPVALQSNAGAHQPSGNVARVSPLPVQCMLLTGEP